MDENVIEWVNGEAGIVLTLSQKKYINRVRRLAKQHPSEVTMYDNPDGTVYATMPLSYLKLTAPREVSDEQREAARQRFSSGSQANQS